MSFDTVLIANRGAIATRIIRTLRRMGLRSVAVYSEADENSLHVAQADEAVCIGPARASDSYLDIDAILSAARATGAGAIHPGYGFLAENVEFAEACAAAGIVFIGPTTDNIRTFGLKHSARALAAAHGVPLAPGTGLLNDEEEGGGGAGYRVPRHPEGNGRRRRHRHAHLRGGKRRSGGLCRRGAPGPEQFRRRGHIP